MAISDLVQLQLGWLNAWIPSFALVLIQFLYIREFGIRIA